MSDRNSYQVCVRDAAPGFRMALGILWSPEIPRRRRISPWRLLPGHRRRGTARRRGRHSVQRHSVDTPARLEFGIFAAIAACS
jgi:hypothetical protein